jgi:hypothetical protein
MTCSVDMDSAYRIRTAEAKDAAAITRLIQQLAAHDRESTPLTTDYAARWLANLGCGILLAEKHLPASRSCEEVNPLI